MVIFLRFLFNCNIGRGGRVKILGLIFNGVLFGGIVFKYKYYVVRGVFLCKGFGMCFLF